MIKQIPIYKIKLANSKTDIYTSDITLIKEMYLDKAIVNCKLIKTIVKDKPLNDNLTIWEAV